MLTRKILKDIIREKEGWIKTLCNKELSYLITRYSSKITFTKSDDFDMFVLKKAIQSREGLKLEKEAEIKYSERLVFILKDVLNFKLSIHTKNTNYDHTEWAKEVRNFIKFSANSWKTFNQ